MSAHEMSGAAASSSLAPSSVAVDYDPFAGATLARVVPAMAPQREIWLAAKLEREASLAYNESISLRLHGALDVSALQAAVQGLADRHEALRSTLSTDGDKLYIAAQLELPCPLRDLSALDETARDADAAATLQRAVTEPFDLEAGPLLRAELLRLGALDHLLMLTAHHIICDGWSFGVIVRDLAALYAQYCCHGTAPALADPFSQFALDQATHAQSADGRAAEQYWLQRFGGGSPSLDLPTDRVRPRQRSLASQREDRTLDAALIGELKRMGATRGASLYASLLTGFGLLLQRLSGQDDVVIGIPSAGQAVGGHDALVGHCVNVLPLRVLIDAQAPFADALKQVRGDLLDAFEHQQYTLGSLLARLALPRDPSRLPLVSVLFNLDQALDERTVTFPGLSFEFAGNPRAFENFELFVNAVQVEGGVRLECQYNSDLFRAATIRGWLDAYETLLRSAVAAPDEAAYALGLLSAEARDALQSLQAAPTPYPELQLAHEYFEQQADLTPARTAVIHRDTPMSYAALEARANRLAHVLRARGVGRGALVGLSLKRGADMVAAVLAVLKAGAGYVPLDPCFPADRLAFMAQDAALAALVVDDAVPTAFDDAKAPLPSGEGLGRGYGRSAMVEIGTSVGYRASPEPSPACRHPLPRGERFTKRSCMSVLSLRRDAAEIEAARDTRLPRDETGATPDSVAYVIFTSGSTGRPKGVRVTHRSTSNLALLKNEWVTRHAG